MNLKGKKIAVTGGAGGIGSLVAELVAKKGAIPIIIDRVQIQNSKWQYLH